HPEHDGERDSQRADRCCRESPARARGGPTRGSCRAAASGSHRQRRDHRGRERLASPTTLEGLFDQLGYSLLERGSATREPLPARLLPRPEPGGDLLDRLLLAVEQPQRPAGGGRRRLERGPYPLLALACEHRVQRAGITARIGVDPFGVVAPLTSTATER